MSGHENHHSCQTICHILVKRTCSDHLMHLHQNWDQTHSCQSFGLFHFYSITLMKHQMIDGLKYHFATHVALDCSILLDDDCVMNMENMILLVNTHIRKAGLGLSYHPYVVKLKHFDLVLNKIDFP